MTEFEVHGRSPITLLQIDLGTAPLATPRKRGPRHVLMRGPCVLSVARVGVRAVYGRGPLGGRMTIDLSRVGLPARLKHINQRRKRN